MKIRLLPFVITGLVSGGLCWWLANLPIELHKIMTFSTSAQHYRSFGYKIVWLTKNGA